MKEKFYCSREDIDYMIELYESGLSQRQVAKKIGCSHRLVTKKLAENNVKPRDKAFYAKSFSDEVEDKIIEDYNSGMSIRRIAKKYGCTTMPICSLFKRRGLKFREPTDAIGKYKINIHYFDEIDTQDKAYILGFLYADGWNTSVYEHGHYIAGMTLKSNDRYMLENINNLMESTYPIKTTKQEDREYSTLYFCNKHLVLRLHQLGITPRKTFTTTFPEWLSEELIPHFLRGLLDGDGSISSSLFYVNYVGSDALMYSIRNLLYEKFGFLATMYPHYESDGISQLFIYKYIYKIPFLEWIYKDANLKLERKYNLYLKMIDRYKHVC